MDYPLKIPQDHLCFQVYKNSLLITRLYTPFLKTMGITYLQYIVLILLWFNNAHKIKITSIKDICKELGIDSGTISPLIKALIKKGLLEKKADRIDQRQVVVSLTAKGFALEHKVPELQKSVIRELALAAKDPYGLLMQLVDFSAHLRGREYTLSKQKRKRRAKRKIVL